jgi:hypothetical protein
VEPKTDAELQKEHFEAEEARRLSQTQFDVKIHGFGTTPIVEPQSTKELYNWVSKKFQEYDARLAQLEHKKNSFDESRANAGRK